MLRTVGLEVPEGPPRGGPSRVLGPGGRIRTGIAPMDSRSLYHLRYPGAVRGGLSTCRRARKMVYLDLARATGAKRVACPSVPEYTPKQAGLSVAEGAGQAARNLTAMTASPATSHVKTTRMMARGFEALA